VSTAVRHLANHHSHTSHRATQLHSSFRRFRFFLGRLLRSGLRYLLVIRVNTIQQQVMSAKRNQNNGEANSRKQVKHGN
jgi:hypothetical protein